MIRHIVIKKGKRSFLLLRDEDRFHIIEENDALTPEIRNRILERLHTPEEMGTLGLSGQTISKEDLQGIAVYGCASGADLEFHFSRFRKQSYRLAQRYEPRFLDDFFRGITRIPTPGKRLVKGGGKDWRSREQDQKLRKPMRRIGLVVNVLSFVYPLLGLLIQRIPQEAMLLGSGLLLAADVFLAVAYPEHFTFLGSKTYRKAGGKTKVTELWGAFVPAGILGLTGIKWYEFFSWPPEYGYAIAVGLILGILGFLLLQDFRDSLGSGFACMALCVLLCIGSVGHLNHYLGDAEPVVHTVPIVEMWKSTRRRGGTDYICRVEFPDGRTLDLEVSREVYEAYEIGDTMDVTVRTGGLGIEYAYK
jgi:hypothetical protein